MLALRALQQADEAAAEAAHTRMSAEGFTFLLYRDRVDTFREYLDLLQRQHAGGDARPGQVRESFLIAEVNGQIVGRVSIRHELNDHLKRRGGHIGFGVLPEHRRRGYATTIFRRSLDILAAEGLTTALVTCDDDNLPSIATIERCGGQLAERANIDGVLVRRYHVPTT